MDRHEADETGNGTSYAGSARGIFVVVDADASYWRDVSDYGQSCAFTMDRQRATGPGYTPVRGGGRLRWRHAGHRLGTVADSFVGFGVCAVRDPASVPSVFPGPSTGAAVSPQGARPSEHVVCAASFNPPHYLPV